MAATLNIRSAKVLAAAFLLTFAISFAVSALVSPDGASAQSPSFCEQYPNDPDCDDDRPDGNDDKNPDGDSDVGPAGGPLGGDSLGGGGGGELPFTGYPLSPLLILLLMLLAAGLILRGYVAVRDRLAVRNTLG